MHYWKVENPALLSSKNFPVFVSYGLYDDLHIYGAPSHEYPGLIKVSLCRFLFLLHSFSIISFLYVHVFTIIIHEHNCLTSFIRCLDRQY